MSMLSFAKQASLSLASVIGTYLGFLALVTTTALQSHVVYLHKFQMTWFKDLDTPENFGFLHNQVTPFTITSRSGEALYAWHILPIELYREKENQLLSEASGHCLNITIRLGFRLLLQDPSAYLIIHMHGAAGTVGSGYRVPNYRALAAGDAQKIHVLTFDYPGFGRSSGTPTEEGIILDAVSVVEWALDVAGVAPSRILLFGQSLGAAVNLAVAEHFASQSPPIHFIGHVLVAPFVNGATLMATYSIGGIIPLFGPVAKVPPLFKFFKQYLSHTWSSKDRVSAFIRANEAHGSPYQITIIHAEDDHDVPSTHSQELFWHAVNASVISGISREEFERARLHVGVDLGSGGTVMQWRTSNGVLREELLKTGLHDMIMGNSVVTLAVMRILRAAK